MTVAIQPDYDNTETKTLPTKDPVTGVRVYGDKADEIRRAREAEYAVNPPKYEGVDPDVRKVEASLEQNRELQNAKFKTKMVTAVISNPTFRQTLLTNLAEVEAVRKHITGAEALAEFDDGFNALLTTLGLKE